MKQTITLRLLEKRQRISGFGTSACWWSPQLSDTESRRDILRRLYSKEGLGLNIYRYNIGGGVNPNHERVQNPWRLTESFLVIDSATGEGHFDFSRDQNAQATLFEALSYGCVDTVVLFANSPHYSMTVSGESSGGLAPHCSNLRKDSYERFVDYFLTITEYFLSKGVPVKLLSPINEPQWKWGGDDVRQEGCHYETQEVVRLLHLFAEEIEKRRLPVRLAAPESGEIGEKTREYFTALAADSVILRNLGSFAYHSYWADGDVPAKTQLGDWYDAQAFSSVPLDMTEWCELPNKHPVDDPMAAALMAAVIAEDLAGSRAQSWTTWVAVNQTWLHEDGRDYSDGLFTANDDYSRYAATYRLDAVGHFSRFVPPGSTCIGCALETDETAAVTPCAFERPDGATVLVLSNTGAACDVQLQANRRAMEVFTTDAEHHLAHTYSGAPLQKLTLPAVSVTTVVLLPA